MKLLDLQGKHFGRWLVIRRDTNSDRHSRWVCQCACGKIKSVQGGNLRWGTSSGCGCQRRGNRKHGYAPQKGRSSEYTAWKNMLSRCYNPHRSDYIDYGGRGIKVDPRWRGYSGFVNFLADMGKKPEPSNHYSLDQFPNNDGDYGPQNCRWATANQQVHNRRARTKNLSKSVRLLEKLSGLSLTDLIQWYVDRESKTG